MHTFIIVNQPYKKPRQLQLESQGILLPRVFATYLGKGETPVAGAKITPQWPNRNHTAGCHTAPKFSRELSGLSIGAAESRRIGVR